MKNGAQLFGAAGLVALMAGMALGQAVTPPPASSEKPDRSVRRLAPRPVITPQTVDATAQPTQTAPAQPAQPAPESASAPARPTQPDLTIPESVRNSAPIVLQPGVKNLEVPAEPEKKPVTRLQDIPYEPLAQKDESGALIPLSEPVHLAALRKNPLVQPAVFDSIGIILRERKASFEQIAVANLDLLEKIKYDDVYGKTAISDSKDVRALLTVTKPLSPPAAPKFLGTQLKELGLITAQQDAYTMRILRDYAVAVVDAGLVVPEGDTPEARAAKAKRSELIVKTIYRQNVDEAVFVYNSMLSETVARIGTLLPQIGLDEATLAKAQAVVAAANGNGDQMLSELRGVTTLDQRRELLRKMLATRESK